MNGSFATSAVPGTRFADVQWVAETGSTNQDLLSAASEGVPEGRVLVADHQTAGRGRLDRTWTAPPGASLLVSVLLRPQLDPEDLFFLTLTCGLAARHAIAEVTGVKLGVKWPNDLVVAEGPLVDRKVAGILAESHVADGKVDAVVVGMGLNLNWPTDLPEDLVQIAASVNHLLGEPIDRDSVLRSWLTHYERYLTELSSGPDRRNILDEVHAVSATLGRNVRVEQSGGSFEGLAVDIGADGRLLVETDSGIVVVAVGDVVHARLLS